jgi:hypothetical protein
VTVLSVCERRELIIFLQQGQLLVLFHFNLPITTLGPTQTNLS